MENAIEIATAIGVGILLLLKGLQIFAKFTKTTKDDEFIAKVIAALESAGVKDKAPEAK